MEMFVVFIVLVFWYCFTLKMEMEILKGEVDNIFIDLKLGSVERLRKSDIDSIKSILVSLTFCKYEYFEERLKNIFKMTNPLSGKDCLIVFSVVEKNISKLSFFRRKKVTKLWQEILYGKENLSKVERKSGPTEVVQGIIATHE